MSAMTLLWECERNSRAFQDHGIPEPPPHFKSSILTRFVGVSPAQADLASNGSEFENSQLLHYAQLFHYFFKFAVWH